MEIDQPAGARRRISLLLALTVSLAAAALVRPWAAWADDGGSALPAREPARAIQADLPSPGISAFLGVAVAEDAGVVSVSRVVPGSPAARAGLLTGDVLLAAAGRDLARSKDLERVLAQHAPGDRTALRYRRDGREEDLRIRLRGRRRMDGLFRGSVFRLAVVPLHFADDTAAPSRSGALSSLLLERGGQSVAAYFARQSHDRLRLSGKVFAPIVLSRPRADYAERSTGAHAQSPFAEAARLLVARERARAVGDFDGIAFLYDAPAETRSGRALWPHRSTVEVGERRLPYYVHAVGLPEGDEVGGHCHEFAHLLGLPDTYGVGHRTGCGDFCLMSLGHRGGPSEGASRPFSLCAWCKVRLGWADPAIVDPRTPQRIRLRPIDESPDQVVLIPFTRRTDAYILLEVRARRGDDAELPDAGLLVWRVGCAPTRGQGRYGAYLDLVEAHGVDTFDASLHRADEIAFPTRRARDLTPDTRPALWAGVRDAFEIHVTDIRREGGGAISFTIGVETLSPQDSPEPFDGNDPDENGHVVRDDPITGERVRYLVPGAPAPGAK